MASSTRSKRLRDAVAEAKRFIKAAKAAQSDLDVWGAYAPSKNVAAAKRASLDLSRALSKFRGRE